MRITLVLPHAGLGGGIRVMAEFARRLKARGHQVLAVSIPQRPPTAKERAKAIIKHGYWLSAPRRSPSHLDGVDIEHRVLESCRPVRDSDLPAADVVVATWCETAEWVARLSRSKGAKAYYIQLDEREVSPDDLSWRHRVAATWRLPLYKIATSDVVKRAVEEDAGCSGIPLVVIGVDMQQFNAPPRGKQPEPRVGFLYEKNVRKGPDVAAQVAHLIHRELQNTVFVALSSSPDAQLSSFPTATVPHIRPTHRQLRELYAGCDVWLCTSRCEGFHLPPMEAMACRCPVVSTRVGGPVDMIQDGVNGFLLNIDDVNGLSSRVLEVLKLTESAWRSISEAAHATAQQFSWEDATVRFEQALNDAVECSDRRQLTKTAQVS